MNVLSKIKKLISGRQKKEKRLQALSNELMVRSSVMNSWFKKDIKRKGYPIAKQQYESLLLEYESILNDLRSLVTQTEEELKYSERLETDKKTAKMWDEYRETKKYKPI